MYASLKHVLIVVLFLLAGLSSWGVSQDDAMSLDDFAQLEQKVVSVTQRCMAASVGLGSKDRPENGSAVVVTKDGLVLTAYHVIQGLPDEDMIVSFVDGRKVKAKKLGGVPKLDIAMVQITDPGEYPFAEVGDFSEVHVGDWCVSISHAAGFKADRTPPVRMGRVINKNHGNYVQISSTLIGGDSGGPTFDLNGKVIGIHSNIGGRLNQNQACPISNFTKKDHWQRLLDGEVWGKPGEEKKKKPKKDPEAKDPDKKDPDKKDPDKKDPDKKDPDKKDPDTKDPDTKDPDTKRDDDATEKKDQKEADKEAEEGEQEPSEDEPESKPAKKETPAKKKTAPKEIETSLEAFEPITATYRQSIVRFWRRGRLIVSGTIVSEDGLIVTKSSELLSRHFEIELPSGERVPGTIVARLKENDLLFVRVAGTHKPVHFDGARAKADVTKIPLGSMVVAAGYGGHPVALGVKSVEIRNLYESGYAVLGVELGTDQKDLSVKGLGRGSAARKSGIRKGDRITKIGGEAMESLDQLREKLRSLKPNSRVPVEFERDGRVAATLVKLGSSLARDDQAATQGYPQGGRISRKRTEFTNAFQSDTPFGPKDVGAPLIDFQGRVVGLNIARAGRIKSYTLPCKTVLEELKRVSAMETPQD